MKCSGEPLACGVLCSTERLVLVCDRTAAISYSMLFKAILKF